MSRLLLALTWLFTTACAAQSATQCRAALVLALDVSGSVNQAEYQSQLEGLAGALGSPEVRQSILSGGPPVDIAVFEWSSRNHQILIQPWKSLQDDQSIDQVVARLSGYRRQRAGLKTAMGTALLFAAELLRDRDHCWQRTIDVSADGKNNIGPPPGQVYRLPVFDGVTVNALIVTDPNPGTLTKVGLPAGELKRHFEREVVHGPGAFAMVADGYLDYQIAMQRKLLRELAAPSLSELGDHFLTETPRTRSAPASQPHVPVHER